MLFKEQSGGGYPGADQGVRRHLGLAGAAEAWADFPTLPNAIAKAVGQGHLGLDDA